MKSIRRAVLGFSVAILASGLASASTLTETFTSLSSTTDFTGSMNAAQFNPSLGTLNSIQIIVGAALSTQLTITNTTSNSPSSGTARTELQVVVDDSPLTLLTNGGYTSSGNFAANFNTPELDLLTGTASYNLSAGGSTTSGLITLQTKTTGNICSGSPAPVASCITYDSFATNWGAISTEFTGTGNVSLYGGTLTSTLVGNTGGNTNVTQATTAAINATVVFDYTAAPPPPSSTPEPTTLVLMGTALVGIGLLRKRIKS